MQYNLNPNNAREVGQSSRITEKGGYTGVIVRAEMVKSDKGTQGIEFAFKADSGATADYLTVWTINSEGKELYGRKVIDALMTCLSLRTINATRGQIKKYNNDTKQEETVTTTLFPELMNKPVGLLLVREEYAKGDGSPGAKMSIVGCYDSQGRLPKEVLGRLPATALPKVIESLRDKPLKRKAQQSGAYDVGGYANDNHGAAGSDFGDDIPF